MPFPPMPDANFMLQYMYPPTPRSGIPNMLQPINLTGMPRPPDMENFLQSGFPPMMPKMDYGTNQFVQTPISISDNNLRQDQMMADFVSQRAREQEHLRLPPRNFDAVNVNVLNAVNPNVLNADQFSSMLPLAGSSSQKKASVKRQLPVTNDANYGPAFRRSVTPELTPHVPKLLQDDMSHVPDAGWNTFEKFPSEGCSITVFSHADNTPVSDKHTNHSALSEGCQADSSSELSAQASKNLIISSSTNLTNMVSPTISGASKGKGVQIENNTGTEKLMDDDIASFFLSEASDNMNNIVANTSSQTQEQQQEFPFIPIKSIHASNNKLSCCDFSAQGRFLAAAGHEKKVFIWHMKNSTRHSIQGHTQLVTDIRFKPNSYLFATSSFDGTVKIWDAANGQKLLFDLIGHGEQVMSADFHPRKTNILCSCDCNEEIRLWNAKESTCFRTLKGGNRQVRFQSRHGNLLAASIRNVINLIDVETGMIQQRLEGHEKEVRTLCWDVCGEYLVSTSQDSTRIWSVACGAGKCIHELHSSGLDFTSCTFHPAYSQVVAVGSYESIYIWNPTMGNKTWKFPGHGGIISAMANSPDTNMMASVGHDQWVKVWK